MENKKNAMTLLLATILATFVLSGCTGADMAPVPTPEPTQAESTHDNAEIFGQQKSSIERTEASAVVLKQISGTGPSTIPVDSLPEGYTELGWTVACTGAGEWKAAVVQTEPAWSQGACSLEPFRSARHSVGEPTNDHSVEIKVEEDAQIWVTLFATK
ncbi:hypothetical protein CQ018_08500 [Arthrobacter sp. MYb227]|uniref:hypothetical protein n=1 Tax=Arthrobacter sp. MYb227 TaxID=1848601 RepID=UPI000CFDBF84|nr:hypothetical protein [Arthrobacter sp. MYb227]PQZ93688.1 hypothetical protein CQ018_08500 [Arthrobacter sp. MYb227]